MLEKASLLKRALGLLSEWRNAAVLKNAKIVLRYITICGTKVFVPMRVIRLYLEARVGQIHH